MRCFHPIKGGLPCGKCPACLANRQRQFTFRLEQERSACSFFYWLTLTYDDEHLPTREMHGKIYSVFRKEDCRHFFESIRKKFAKSYNVKFKHFLVSEYGPTGTERPHYHTLLFVYCPESWSVKQKLDLRSEISKFFDKAWPCGFVYEKSFHNRVFRYVTKYCCKPELIGQDKIDPPFTLISPGIGLSLLDKLDRKKIVNNLDFSVHMNGKVLQLPRYYLDKVCPHGLSDIILVPRTHDSRTQIEHLVRHFYTEDLQRLFPDSINWDAYFTRLRLFYQREQDAHERSEKLIKEEEKHLRKTNFKETLVEHDRKVIEQQEFQFINQIKKRQNV